MNGTMTLEQSAIREVSSLFGNDSALKKIISFTKRIKKENKAAVADDSNVMTPEDKKEILADIKEALVELKMAKEGKVKLKTWEEFMRELHD